MESSPGAFLTREDHSPAWHPSMDEFLVTKRRG